MKTSTYPRGQLWSRLARERQMMSLMEREILPVVEPFARKRENWVPMWVDLGHRVQSEVAGTHALRAITDLGELLWFVRQEGKRHGYHSSQTDPVAAMEEAQAAALQRRTVRQNWGAVRALRRDVIAGRKRFSATRADAYASPLCTLGVDGFMRRIGCAKVDAMPARLLALLMPLDDQIGFVLWQAWKREQAAQAMRGAVPTAVAAE